MSILPKWHHGRVCIPWWYALIYAAWAPAVIIGIRGSTMEILLSNESLIALIACAFVGSLMYVAFNALSKYEKQKRDAEEIRNKVAASGRDPTAEETLTASEKWEITKAQKFDKIFLIADIFAVIIGTGLAVAFLYLFGGAFVSDEAAKYGVLGFIAGIVATLVLNETLVKAAAQGLWEEKSAEAFRIISTATEDVIEAKGGFNALIEKYVAAGLSKKEARDLAKQKLLEDPDALDKL